MLRISGGIARQPPPEAAAEVIYLVDDDVTAGEDLAESLASRQLQVMLFRSAAAFLSFTRRDEAACLLVHHFAGVDGLALQRQLAGGSGLPIIFLSSEGDVPAAVRALKEGAIDFLTTPVDFAVLLGAIATALAEDRLRRRRNALLQDLLERHATLTPRERQVLPLVASGMLNKQTASLLGISVVTLQIHRGQIMRKMAARSLAELVRMAESLSLGTTMVIHAHRSIAPGAPLARATS